jgi:hypothetical protein
MKTITIIMSSYFIKACDLLGIRYLKKYWPVGGSYWNRNHIDKENMGDLKRVIYDATDYTRQHIVQFSTTNFIFVGSYITEYFLLGSNNLARVVPFLVPYNIYEILAFSLHHYNRLKAKDQIKRLIEKDPSLKDDDNILTNGCNEKEYINGNLKLYYSPFNKSYNLSITKDDSNIMTKYNFSNLEDGIKFIEYIIEYLDPNNYDELCVNYTLHKFKQLYYEFYRNRSVNILE